MIWFQKKRVELGEGHVTQYIVWEWKQVCSLIFYRWETIDQVRFHTHAFPAVAFLLSGWYHEVVRFGEHMVPNFVNVPFVPRYLPRGYCHSVLASKPGTFTMVIAGPWQKHWFEWFQESDTWVKYTWGRKVVEKTNEVPPEVREGTS